MNPELDLSLERVIKAPVTRVWDAWTDPRQLEQWWIPAPARCRVDRYELRHGGAFVTSVAEPGEAMRPHLDACFLDIRDRERIVYTTAIDSGWRPAPARQLRVTATITMQDASGGGTLFRAVVQHADPAERAEHLELGFEHGWGTVVDQLAARLEGTGRPA